MDELCRVAGFARRSLNRAFHLIMGIGPATYLRRCRLSEARIFYWRTHVGAEVDLVIEKHGRLVLAVEIKAGKRVVGADLTGLRSFGEAHPRVRRMAVAQVPESYRLGGVSVVPCREFLGRLEALVEKHPA